MVGCVSNSQRQTGKRANHQNMEKYDIQPEPPSADERLEQALDRLGALLAPPADDETGFVSRVMQRIGDAPAPRRPQRPQRLARLAVAVAACVIATVVLWRATAAHRPAPEIVTTNTHDDKSAPADSPAVAAAAMRTSTWSTVSESVVLENDVPVRKLLYREFERVELVDTQGKTEGQMVVPTKAMLVATKERY
jgi:hypothetical protein